MPIKRLSENRIARFPCIGKLRKGSEKRKNAAGKEIFGKDLDHFRFDTDEPEAAKVFADAYGPEPKFIQVYLPYPTANENLTDWMEEYSAGGLLRRCDGETMNFHRDEQGRASLEPTACQQLCEKACGCKAVGRLTVIIPQLARLAYVLVETHSLYDIIQLKENLLAAESMAANLTGVPFILGRRDREISTPDDKDKSKRVRRTKSLLFIEPDPIWVALKIEEARQRAMPRLNAPSPADVRGLLSAPVGIIEGDTSDDDDDIVDVEQSTSNGAQALKIAQSDIDTIEALGVALYGNENDWAIKRPLLAAWASGKKTNNLINITPADGEVLIRELEKRIRTEYEKLATPFVDAGIVEPLTDTDQLQGIALAAAMQTLRKALAETTGARTQEVEPA